MVSPPEDVYWVDMELSGDLIPYIAKTSAVRGGKRASLAACLEAKKYIKRADPKAEVRIFKAELDWVEVDDKGTPLQRDAEGL